jgi:uncharacterized membrane protein
MAVSWRLISGHRRTFMAMVIGAAGYFLLPAAWGARTRGIVAWDIGSLAFLLLAASLFRGASPEHMEANAAAQEEGEWTLFWLVVAGATASIAAIIGEFGTMKQVTAAARELKVTVVGITLLLSWLLIHAVFALRYAHEYYTRSSDAPALDGGLEFPQEAKPDYWDFFYFSVVLSMTFQVSDVQITSRKLRRLATLHGMLGFMFNTVIVALTVNLASGLLS